LRFAKRSWIKASLTDADFRIGPRPRIRLK
jgi:hypothetical protein